MADNELCESRRTRAGLSKAPSNAIAALAMVFAMTLPRPAVSQPLPSPPGRLVDIDGKKMHLLCSGSGGPTILLESGASSFAIDWARVQPVVAKGNRVCSYDRAGYGWSEPVDHELRGEDAVRRLHAALDAGGEKAPFVLVGQSMGGRLVRLFATPVSVRGQGDGAR